MSAIVSFLFAVLLAAGMTGDPPAELGSLSFLIGEWEPVGAAGGATFSRSLQGSVILRSSYAEYPGQAGGPPSRHEDLMVIYVEQGAIRADYYDNEKHVIRYAVTVPAVGEAVFLSDAVTGAPRYRLSYKLAADGKLGGLFEIAPSGKPDAFSRYLAWDTIRKDQRR